MVQRLDARERKRVIAEAVLRITARQGLDAVSVRDVAAEANVSAGMVQHHFKTKDDMLLFACQYMIERGQARAQARAHVSSEAPSVRATLRTMFEQWLPLDEERRIGVRVWIAFLARAVVEPELERFMRETHQASHALIEAQLRQGQRTGELSDGVDPEHATIAIFMLLEGLVSHVLVGHYTGEQALRVIDDQLATLFTRDAQ